MDKMTIRQATQKDAQAIGHVQVESYLDAYKLLLPAEYLVNFNKEGRYRWVDIVSSR